MDDPVTAYARAAVAGDILVGNLVRLACRRHLDDLERGGERGLTFDVAAASRAIAFFGFLNHSKGEWAGRPLTLEPWEQFIVGSIFGWKRADGTRRFRKAYDEIARKNGKSTLAAGVGLILFVFDNEPGAEIYSAATKRDQARIVHSEAIRMVRASPDLREMVRVYKDNLNHEASNSKFEPLGADEDTMDGLNPAGVIIDELHAHKTRAVVDVLETAVGARRQPLIFEITTAGVGRHSVCWDHREYSLKVLTGVFQDDSWFAYIATIDEGDSWVDEKVWPKANPNLGISVKLSDLREQAERAQKMPSAENEFRRKRLNEWTEQSVRWMPMAVWDGCPAKVKPQTKAEWDALEKSFEQRVCYGGLDLSNKLDLTASILAFPEWTNGEIASIDLLCRFWVPEAGARKRGERDRVPYPIWIKQGLITATEGEVVDYAFIRRQIQWDAKRFQIKDIAFDPWNATQLATELMGDGLKMIELRQGFQSLTEPTKKLMELALEGKIRHYGHPVLRWNASNVSVKTDPAGNLKPDKERSSEKIDGVVATILAIARIIVQPKPRRSVYEDRGLVVI